MSASQGGRSENSVLPRTPCTPRISDNYSEDFFRHLKSTIDLCFDILVGVQRAQIYLTINPKYLVYFGRTPITGVRGSTEFSLLPPCSFSIQTEIGFLHYNDFAGYGRTPEETAYHKDQSI